MDYYHQLRFAAAKSRRKFLYDTNVGAGLPVIENLQNLLSAGDELQRFGHPFWLTVVYFRQAG